MGLNIGWRIRDTRESIWKDDDSLVDVSAAAMDSWKEDGDASHLRMFAKNGDPQIITWRPLSQDEIEVVRAFHIEATNTYEALARSWNMCFRIAVDFKGVRDEYVDYKGRKWPRIVNQRGMKMLSKEFSDGMEDAHPGIQAFYGNLIFAASFLSPAEKKASSPPSTPTPSGQASAQPAPAAAA